MGLDLTRSLLSRLFHGEQPSYQEIDEAAQEVKEARRLLGLRDQTTIQVQDPTPTPHDQTVRLLGETLGALVCLISEMRHKQALTAVTSEVASLVLEARQHLHQHHHESETLRRYEKVSFEPLSLPPPQAQPRNLKPDIYPESDLGP